MTRRIREALTHPDAHGGERPSGALLYLVLGLSVVAGLLFCALVIGVMVAGE